MNMTEMGKAGLTGWRRKVGERVAPRVAAKTPMSEDQFQALLGAIFLVLAVYQFYATLRRVWDARVTGEDEL
jgi:hypothetical protein